MVKFHRQKIDFVAEIKRAAEYLETAEGNSPKFNYCHLHNHMVKRLQNFDCDSPKHLGALK